ncbi:chorismate mutase [Alphaproteobacteria bacterium]|nr:chorismate mutase [Alphaproteobacteria bacterium]
MSLKKTIDTISELKNPLQNIRNKIDSIDNKIHDLLIERAEIVEQVVEEKKKSKETNLVVYRPSREHEILVRIIQRHKGNLPEKSLINIWRNLISSYISMQAELTLSFCPTLDKIVNNHFGENIKKEKAITALEALQKLNSNKVNITVLPYPNKYNDWWVNFQRFENIFVIGSISENYIGVPQALILGKQNIEYADKNIIFAIIEIQSKDIKKYSSFLLLNNYSIITVGIRENGKSVIIFSTKTISREEVESKIKIIENNKFNIQDSPKIMGIFAVFK